MVWLLMLLLLLLLSLLLPLLLLLLPLLLLLLLLQLQLFGKAHNHPILVLVEHSRLREAVKEAQQCVSGATRILLRRRTGRRPYGRRA